MLSIKRIGKITSIVFLSVYTTLGIIAIILDLILNQGQRVIFGMVLDLFNTSIIVIGIITGGVAVTGAIDKYNQGKNNGVSSD